MTKQQPPIQTVQLSEAKDALPDLVDAVSSGEAWVVIEHNGAPLAVLVSTKDLERMSRLEREREERFSVIDRMRDAFADVSPEEIEREAERTVAEARERIRQRSAEPAVRSA